MRLQALSLTTLALLAATACTQEATIPERTETTVSASGGTALSASGELTLRIPAGTVPDGTRVIITTDRSARPGTVGPSFELDTQPRVSRFSPAIAIELKNPQPAQVVELVNLDGPAPVVVTGARYDAATGLARGELEHFSRYGLATVAAPMCPESAEPNEACSGEGLRCQFGQECCCGTCYPSLDCTCAGGTWACAATDACLGAPLGCEAPDAGTPVDSGTPDAGGSPCPSEAEVMGASCSSVDLVCEYGTQTCCGQTFPSMRCACDGTGFACHATDYCLLPPGSCLPVVREYEPNDAPEQANLIDVGTTVSATIAHLDRDLFRFTAAVATASTTSVRLRTHTDRLDPTSCNGLDTQLTLNDADFTWGRQAEGGPSAPCATLIAPLDPSRSLYIARVVTSTAGAPVPTQPYFLTVDLIPYP